MNTQDNFRGSLFMLAAMAGFALEDMVIKLMSSRLNTGEILIILGLGGGLIFWALLAQSGHRMWTKALLNPAVVMRNLAEVVGTMGYVSALILTPLTSATAILQATPLVVVMGAALFLGETVGWRRWSAVIIGLLGMILIVRPGVETFDPGSLFAVLGVLGLAARDLITRRVPTDIPSYQLSASAFFAVVPAGIVIMLMTGSEWVTPNAINVVQIIAAWIIGVIAYLMIVLATRIGQASAIAPYRYSRLVFGLIIGMTVFAERPDFLTLLGAGIIVGSGLYTFAREAHLNRVR